MFTGLVQTTGTVFSLQPTAGALRLTIAAPELAGQWKEGDSIAVNGVCLTAIIVGELDGPHPGRFAADLAEETVQRTTLSGLEPGALVNLELPTPAGSPLGGHVVQGHVDGTGRLLAVRPLHPDLDATDWRLSVEIPPTLAPQVIPQGSITLDGISLTVASLGEPDDNGAVVAEIAIIPHTYKSTNLRSLLSDARMNIETDVLSKYAERRARAADAPAHNDWAVSADLPGTAPVSALPSRDDEPHKEWLTVEYLLANGY